MLLLIVSLFLILFLCFLIVMSFYCYVLLLLCIIVIVNTSFTIFDFVCINVNDIAFVVSIFVIVSILVVVIVFGCYCYQWDRGFSFCWCTFSCCLRRSSLNHQRSCNSIDSCRCWFTNNFNTYAIKRIVPILINSLFNLMIVIIMKQLLKMSSFLSWTQSKHFFIIKRNLCILTEWSFVISSTK